MLVNGLPEETGIIYVMNMARPTPATGIPLEAPDEVLRSDSTLQHKIADMMEALGEFEKYGNLPIAVELGNEFYFDNEHAAIYAANPALYLDHAKMVASAIKLRYPDINIILITTKGGTTGRDYWNNNVFDTLASDSQFRELIHAVVQHHYINENYGDLTPVTNLATAKTAIAEGIQYTRESKSDYDLVPDGIRLWITEYGATKPNAEGTWAAGLRGAAMTISWMDLGDKIEILNYQHITDDPNIINITAMKAGPVGISMGMLGMAARGKTSAARIEISGNPISNGTVESLHGYKFFSDSSETLYIINISDSLFSNIDIDPLMEYTGERSLIRAYSELPYLNPVYDGKFINTETTTPGGTIDILPLSVNVIEIKYAEPSSISKRKESLLVKIYPTQFSDYFITESDLQEDLPVLELISMSGKTFYTSMISPGINYHSPDVDAGMYIIRISSKNRIANLRLIKLE